MINLFRRNTTSAVIIDIPKRPLTIGIDFDGTCVEHKYPETWL